jgi:hypothetical protein
VPDDGAPILAVSESVIDLGEIEPGEFIEPQRIDVTNAGGGTLEWSVTCNDRWVSIQPDEDGMTVRLRPRLGPNRAEIVVRDASGGVTRTVQISVRVHPPAPRPARPAARRPVATLLPTVPVPVVPITRAMTPATRSRPPENGAATPRPPGASGDPPPRRPRRTAMAALLAVVTVALVAAAVLVGTGVVSAPWDHDEVSIATPSTSPPTTVAALATSVPAAPIPTPSTVPLPRPTTTPVRTAPGLARSTSPCQPLTVQIAAERKTDPDVDAFRAEAARLIGSVPAAGTLHDGDGATCDAKDYLIYYVGPFDAAATARSVCLAIGAELASDTGYVHFRTGASVHWPFYRDERDRVRNPNGALFLCQPGAA